MSVVNLNEAVSENDKVDSDVQGLNSDLAYFLSQKGDLEVIVIRGEDIVVAANGHSQIGQRVKSAAVGILRQALNQHVDHALGANDHLIS